ncbi:MAG: 4Fe-4S cluster-binding domain-containing protein [Marinifilum sp.]|jgi:L-lysine 2,3-aminomutase|nr:4Fe-4S cluster-binding domain-containing protein [Marinifilum sp.]
MRFITYNAKNFRKIEYIRYLPETIKRDIEIVAKVIPFKTNNYVVDYLIDWDNYENDPIYILNFPNRDMLLPEQFEQVKRGIDQKLPENELYRIINRIRMELNPHPAQQMTNIPELNGEKLNGVQHKYRDIVLFFPTQGQSCHAHCTFCFRWPQFTKELDLQFSMREIDKVIDYIRKNEYVHELLFTGGDPMIMSPATLKNYIQRILDAKLPNLESIRFGTKSLSYWPFTFLPIFNQEAGEMLDMFKQISDAGIHLSIMAHFNHHVELDNEVVQEAIMNIRASGAQIRTQAPLLNHINNSSKVWAEMWKMQVNLGLVPYYMFIERETGPYKYFQVSLSEAYKVYTDAVRQTGSLAKTVTGPVMSAAKGKVQVLGIIENPLDGKKQFMMQYVRHRDYNQTFRPFYMEFNETATWVDQLKPLIANS